MPTRDDVPADMHASVLTAPRDIRVEKRAVPAIGADQVLVKVASVGVCGSDVHFYRDGGLGEWRLNGPLVLGHESGGTIVATGADVDPARMGQRVSIEPQRPSQTSWETLSGRYNLDPAMEFYAVPGVDGAFAEYVAIQSHFAHPVPDALSDDAAALLEPLSVAVAAARKADLTVGSRVLVAGAGPIGIIMTQVARAYGASDVVVTDPEDHRRQQALRFGATQALDPTTQPVGRLGLDVDAFIDASGAPAAVSAGIAEVRAAGRVVLVGMGESEMGLPVEVIQSRELVLTGVFRYANTWHTAIELVRLGKVDLDSIITGHFGLTDVAAALESTARPTTCKSIVRPAEEQTGR